MNLVHAFCDDIENVTDHENCRWGGGVMWENTRETANRERLRSATSCVLAFLVAGLLCSLAGGCARYAAPEVLARRDPSQLSPIEAVILVRWLSERIQDGFGTYQIPDRPGSTHLDAYIDLIEAARWRDGTSTFHHLSSSVVRAGGKYNYAGEAVVLEGYGDRACVAIMRKAREWEKIRKDQVGSWRAWLGTELFSAYTAVMDLRSWQYLHAHPEIVRSRFPKYIDPPPREKLKWVMRVGEARRRGEKLRAEDLELPKPKPGDRLFFGVHALYDKAMHAVMLQSGDKLYKEAYEGLCTLRKRAERSRP